MSQGCDLGVGVTTGEALTLGQGCDSGGVTVEKGVTQGTRAALGEGVTQRA